MKQHKRIHFIGIGGIGMSGIARMFLAQGYHVQGSDLKSSDIIELLRREGAEIFLGHDAKHIESADLVVYSSSIMATHVERAHATRMGIPVIHRAEALAELCRHKFTIAVTGTHGKTTTTSMIGMILKEAGRDPSVVVGGVVSSFGGNACIGGGEEIVIEADESDSSFLRFAPDLEVITNIEPEHMEHFGSMDKVMNAYRGFVGRMSYFGKWFGCAHEPFVQQLAKENLRPSLLYGWDSSLCRFYATDVVECPNFRPGIAFNLWQEGRLLGPLRLKVMGRHNVLNAQAAVAVGFELGISFSVIRRALEKFEGARRRFDVRYHEAGIMVVEDYAHHPTELKATVNAAMALKKGRLLALFQPHRYSRTRDLYDEFLGAFDGCDQVWVSDIYAASEEPIEGVCAQKIVDGLNARKGPKAAYLAKDNASSAILGQLREGDILLVLGAGDINQCAYKIADSLKQSRPYAGAMEVRENLPGENIFSEIQGKVLRHEPLSKHTTIKVGGPVDYWVEPKDEVDLSKVIKTCYEKKMPLFMVGLGSNLLPPDEGVNGVFVHLGSAYFKQMSVSGDLVHAKAGVANSLFIQNALTQGLGGCEFLLGIPGNIGGAVAMNAGSHQRSLDSRIESVGVMDWQGQKHTLQRKDIPFTYRLSGITMPVIVDVTLKLERCQEEASLAMLKQYGDYRQKTQDLQHPSAGCMFKNPQTGNLSSGALIERAGLKGMRLGNAQISTKHANFIINLGGAKSEDVIALMRHAQRTIKQKYNIDLETEVKIL